jgi:hypothetical protein
LDGASAQGGPTSVRFCPSRWTIRSVPVRKIGRCRSVAPAGCTSSTWHKFARRLLLQRRRSPPERPRAVIWPPLDVIGQTDCAIQAYRRRHGAGSSRPARRSRRPMIPGQLTLIARSSPTGPVVRRYRLAAVTYYLFQRCRGQSHSGRAGRQLPDRVLPSHLVVWQARSRGRRPSLPGGADILVLAFERRAVTRPNTSRVGGISSSSAHVTGRQGRAPMPRAGLQGLQGLQESQGKEVGRDGSATGRDRRPVRSTITETDSRTGHGTDSRTGDYPPRRVPARRCRAFCCTIPEDITSVLPNPRTHHHVSNDVPVFRLSESITPTQ